MHNLHLAVIPAESAEDACSTVEYHIEDWGNENNWRSICGAVSEDNEVYLTGDGRYPPDEDYDTIDKINNMVRGWINGGGKYYQEKAFEVMKLAMEGKEPTEPFDWYHLSKYANEMHDKAWTNKVLKGREFDVLKDEFKDYQYGECGVTTLDYDEGEKLYVVFIDMHT